ncbi:MAG: helix-turn-helix domain-containing protein [Chloroflexi bacterium]|nr:helix-turn-helix domain-containing protein [Chloroflexota bacterium]
MVEKLCLNVAEASRLLGLSESLTYQLCREGKIPCLKISERRILIPRLQLERLLAEAGGLGGRGERG